MRHLVRAVVLGTLFCLAWGAAAAANDLAPEVGRFLVASESLPDPRFHHSVILLVQHDEQGSGGVVINRPSRLPLGDLFGGRPEFDVLRGTLSYGGPVSPQALVVLAWDKEGSLETAEPVLDDVSLTGPEQLVEWLGQQTGEPAYRIFTGYAGWGPGQLAGEMKRGDWRVLPADAADIFEGDIEQLWARLQKTRVL